MSDSKYTITKLAEQLIFAGYADGTLEKFGLAFRKGKTAKDLLSARTKGVKAGRGKTEAEIGMTAAYLTRVVKSAPKET